VLIREIRGKKASSQPPPEWLSRAGFSEGEGRALYQFVEIPCLHDAVRQGAIPAWMPQSGRRGKTF